MRKQNLELDHTHDNRFSNAIFLCQRYNSIVKNNDNRQRHANFINAYKRKPYSRSDGKVDPNFGQFEFLIDTEVDKYVDIITERSHWYDVTTFEGADEKETAERSKAITKWFHRYCIFPWKKAARNSYKDVFKAKLFGVGIEYWDNPIDLYPTHTDNSDVFPDSDAGMETDTWDYVFVKTKWTPVELYNEIKDKQKAKRNGWNRNAVIEAIKAACGEAYDGVSNQEVFRRFKDGEAQSDEDTEIHLVDAYVREYDIVDGKQISRYTFTESGELVEGQDDSDEGDAPSVKKFLRFQKRLYSEFCNVIALRTDIIADSFYDKGSFGESIYVYCRFYDQAMNRIIRAGIKRGKIFISSENPDEQKRITEILSNSDEVAVLPPETSILETNLRAGDTKTLAEAVRQLKIDTQAGTGSGLVTGSQNVKGRAITAKEAEIQSTEGSSSSASKFKIFAANDAELGIELYRRFIKATKPGSPEARNKKRFIDKMKELGIEKEAYAPENVVIRSIINPSAANPMAKLQSAKIIVQALHVYAGATSEGERRAAKSMIASVSGWESVPFYIPEEDTPFEEDQVFKIGRENADFADPFLNPKNVTIASDDVHPIHIGLHAADMDFKLDIAEQILQTIPDLPIALQPIQLAKVSDILRALDLQGSHIEAHMQILGTAAQTTDDPLNTIEPAQKKLTQIRDREKKLETQVANMLKKLNEDQGDLKSEELRHLQAKNKMVENHEAAMMQLQLQERILKTNTNAEGAAINQQQKLTHKEQDHQLDNAIKVDESIRERSKQVAKANSGG